MPHTRLRAEQLSRPEFKPGLAKAVAPYHNASWLFFRRLFRIDGAKKGVSPLAFLVTLGHAVRVFGGSPVGLR
jgi:hypothetical protein